MALSYAATSDGLGPRATSLGALKAVLVAVTFDASYPTGGEAIAPADIGLSRIDGAWPVGQIASTRRFEWDQTNQKMLVFTAISTQAANASDQSTIVANFIFIGV